MAASARACAAILSLGLFAGLVLQFMHIRQEEFAGPGAVAILWHMAKFFTIWANTVLAFVLAYGALTGRGGAGTFGGVTLWILIVGLVFHLLLKGEAPQSPAGRWADFLLHTLGPGLMALWWLTFAPKDGLRTGHAVMWLGLPLVFFVYALIRGQMTGFYPYFFINPVEQGWGGVLMWSAGLLVAFWAGGMVLVALGRAIAARA